MLSFAVTHSSQLTQRVVSRIGFFLQAFIPGLLIPFGFAPFHYPGLTLMGLACLFVLWQQGSFKQAFWSGFIFGLACFGLGVSWVYVSIHEYGNLNAVVSALITLIFIAYLALFPAGVGLVYRLLAPKHGLVQAGIVFSALWCFGEYARSTVLGGFPWLLLGFGQMDSPFRFLLPIVGVYGASFTACLAAACIGASILLPGVKRYIGVIGCVLLLLFPLVFSGFSWGKLANQPVSVGVIQANFSMRNKWDEAFFWQMLKHYSQIADSLLGKQLIVLPEAAVPLPAHYVNSFLTDLDEKAKQAGSAIILGIPEPTNADETYYYNTLSVFGAGSGLYLKQHLVPFGEFIPQSLERIGHWLNIPNADIKPGSKGQRLVRVHEHAIASLICYEVSYPALLRKQLPQAEWIVSISDDGWFGHSLAMYQKLQMAQVLSMLTARFQVVANNNGLSSVINAEGGVVTSLPPFTEATLEGTIYPAFGTTPWIVWGDTPVLILCLMLAVWRFGIGLRSVFISRSES